MLRNDKVPNSFTETETLTELHVLQSGYNPVRRFGRFLSETYSGSFFSLLFLIQSFPDSSFGIGFLQQKR